MSNKFYITTTLPYVNAAPHLGFALEIIQADVIARYQANLEKEVFFNTGADEHGLKIYQKAVAEKKDPQDYCDEYAAKFFLLKNKLNLSYNNFIRTTDPNHIKATREFWKRCDANDDIYKKKYTARYCVGCELEKTDSELINGKSPIHPDREIEFFEEENYFFRISKYKKTLLHFYDKKPNFVLPLHRQKEIYNFVKKGLKDFSVSRLKNKMPWGIPVPGDDSQVMYVWFDALINYISCLGWPENQRKFESFWGTKQKPNAIQVAGKDNLRQQAAMWQAMLISAGLPTSKRIFIHGFINLAGEKISKSSSVSLPSPVELVDKYGVDAVRYFLLREFSSTEDGDFTLEKFRVRYNADLANGLGNFAARILALKFQLPEIKVLKVDKDISGKIKETKKIADQKLEEFKFNEALGAIWDLIAFGDGYINRTQVWKIQNPKSKIQIISNLLAVLNAVAVFLAPFLPETSAKIVRLKKGEILFPRL